MSIIELLKNVNTENLKAIWQRYGLILFIAACGVIAYLILSPKEVQIIKTEHTKTVYDKTEAKKWETKYNEAQRILSQFSSSENYIIDEKYDPNTGKLISRRIEKKTTTNSTTDSHTVVSSTSSASSNSTVHSSSSTDTTTITTTEKTRHWSTLVSYNYFWTELSLGQGFNMGKSLTVGAMVQYRVDNSGSTKPPASLGLFGLFRY